MKPLIKTWHNYTNTRFEEYTAANDLADDIDKRLVVWKRHLNMFPLSDDMHLKNKGYYKGVVNNNIMLYRIRESKNEVFIA